MKDRWRTEGNRETGGGFGHLIVSLKFQAVRLNWKDEKKKKERKASSSQIQTDKRYASTE